MAIILYAFLAMRKNTMNQRIKELAEQAADGMLSYDAEGEWRLSEREVKKFAQLIAAEEREACAMEADYEAARWSYAPECREPCESIAIAIRARGNK